MIPAVVAHRLRTGWRTLLGAGLVLGVAIGLALASFAAARATASAYGRVLEAADAETAVVAHSVPPEDAAAVLDAQPAITRHRYQGGFLAFIAGVDPALTGGVLASASEGFALELPTLQAGRLPSPDRADEVFVNDVLAEAAGLDAGDDVTLEVRSIDGPSRSIPVTVTGVGILPREAVADQTALTGIVVPTRAFHEANEDLRLYANSRVWLDDPAGLPELTKALSEEGMFLSEIRAQERRGVEDALGPTITVLVAVGALVGLGAVLVAIQVAQRRQERWRDDDNVLRALGVTRGGTALTQLAAVAVEVAVATVVAVGLMLLLSPLAPVGPLHDLDPAQGVRLDLTVAGAGAAALAAVLGLASTALVFSRARREGRTERPSAATASARRPSSLAGLALAVRSRRRAALRLGLASAASAALLAGVATLVVSGEAVIDDPVRYGVDFDVVALNAFGDQTDAGVERTFGGDEVDAAATFNTDTMLVDGQSVPGAGIGLLRGEIGPTILDGEPVRHGDEVVLGVDTAERLDVGIGDEVDVQAATSAAGGPPLPGQALRIVGLATFPAISQQGTDEPRLGVGAMVVRSTFEQLIGSDADLPEWTVASLVDGEEAEDFIESHRDGVEDAVGIPTRWFTDARPAELVQLDAASPALAGAVVATLALLTAVVTQGAWARTRSSGTQLSVLQALGCTRPQLARAAAWQAVPAGLAALAIGLPVGVAGGRLAFSAFARSIALVDDPSSPVWLVGLLLLAVLASVGAGAAVAGHAARRVAGARTLRAATGLRA